LPGAETILEAGGKWVYAVDFEKLKPANCNFIQSLSKYGTKLPVIGT
jgi:hypothetical protein